MCTLPDPLMLTFVKLLTLSISVVVAPLPLMRSLLQEASAINPANSKNNLLIVKKVGFMWQT
jgi:hypothetical protein